VRRGIWQGLRPGVPTILWIVYSPSFAGVPISIVECRRGGVSYLAIIQDEAEASGDRLERTKGIRGLPNTVEDQFGPRICERLELRFVLVYRTQARNGI
jgi:hypothetical protein